ncbi:hypothetical protein HN018_21870 (plasmid) [Lichenicola cladoniae]|uniref:Uncharacterized protein n=1 Tax=Lichenicola cladoniae TaxID=1484109 RepID=A0A6M8HX04_9PROT|nr:hypothetical protein [Lichenicola cladoniae]NPD68981.1 hypothetical protein [Acetobacteraceae bacterium]QKE92880.1 hypothetical protein HN018_21870 [Lichenicola cladoniae]
MTTAMWRTGIAMPGLPGLDAVRIKVHLRANAPIDELKSLIFHLLKLSLVAIRCMVPSINVQLTEPAA